MQWHYILETCNFCNSSIANYAVASFNKNEYIVFISKGEKMKKLLLLTLTVLSTRVYAHEMQHGFILATDDKFASHLVADGMHSRQTEVIGTLTITDQAENDLYQQKKSLNSDGKFYYFMLAQQVDLENVKEGQILSGPIVENEVGKFEPKKVLIKQAQFRIDKVLLNVENPFFKDPQP